MSTDHQRYSIDNQIEAISDYAADHGLDVVRTYADPGKSGLHLKGRLGLQQLLEDIRTGAADYEVLLVYDVSRWGRFQDTDESAYYAHLCSRGGVELVYCAEPFQGFDGPLATIVKGVKRAMAAEYSRELSSKIFRGQAAVVRRGFRPGSRPPYAFERWVVDEGRHRKYRLDPGESKGFAADRVVLVPGPPEEVAQVQLIFALCVDEGMASTQIAKALRARGLMRRGKPWTMDKVQVILNREQYVGDSIYNRRSTKLGGPEIRNPESDWVRCADAWSPIIDRQTFERAREMIAGRRPNIWSDEAMLESLADLLRRKGRLTAQIILNDPDSPCLTAIYRHFGSLTQTFAQLGYSGSTSDGYSAAVRGRRDTRRVVLRQIERGLAVVHASAQIIPSCDTVRSRGVTARVVTPLVKSLPSGQSIWTTQPRGASNADVAVAVRLNPGDGTVLDYHIVPGRGLRRRRINRESSDDGFSIRCETIGQVVECLCRLKSPQLEDRISTKRVPRRARSGYQYGMELPSDRLKQARLAAGYPKASHAAEAFGVPLATYQQHENGIRGFPARRAAKYASLLKVAPEWLLYGHGKGPSLHVAKRVWPEPRYVPIVGIAGSDVWSAPPSPDQAGEVLPVYLPDFQSDPLFALRVHGSSMDLHYLPGAVVIVCPVKPAELREDDHVVIRRQRGALVEFSIKEAARDAGGAAFWPRSSSDRYQAPLRGDSLGSSADFEVVGRVVASYYVRPPSLGSRLQTGEI